MVQTPVTEKPVHASPATSITHILSKPTISQNSGLSPTGSVINIKTPGVRHEPYPQTRRARKTSLIFESPKTTMASSDVQVNISSNSDSIETVDELNTLADDGDKMEDTSPAQDHGETRLSTSTPAKRGKDLNHTVVSHDSNEEDDEVDVMVTEDGVKIKVEIDDDFEACGSADGNDDVNEDGSSAETSRDSFNIGHIEQGRLTNIQLTCYTVKPLYTRLPLYQSLFLTETWPGVPNLLIPI